MLHKESEDETHCSEQRIPSLFTKKIYTANRDQQRLHQLPALPTNSLSSYLLVHSPQFNANRYQWNK